MSDCGREDLTHRIEIGPSWGCARISWIVEGPEGAVEFHFGGLLSEIAAQLAGYPHPDRDLGIVSGIECHWRKPFHYSRNKDEPDHKTCWVLQGPCWHDGTSLGGIEAFRQFIRHGYYPDGLWFHLDAWYRSEVTSEAEYEEAASHE